MKRISKIFLWGVFSIASVSGIAQNNRPLYDYQKEQINFFSSWWHNPAMRFYYPIDKITDVSFSETITNNNIYNIQEGNKSHHFLFTANSFTKEDKQLFYGMATYNKGVQENINWNTLTDINRLYPYIVADTISDKMYKEQYDFAGGYAHKYNKLTLGAFVSYTASTAYDRHDPRPQNTVSDLKVTMGASYPIGSKYKVGFNLYFDKYQQDQSLRIYKEGGSAKIFYLRGLGVADEQFSTVITKTAGGADNTYKQKKYGGTISLYPEANSGIFLALSAATSNLELISGNRNTTICMLDNNTSTVELGYKINRNYNVKLLGEYQQKEGAEYIYTFSGSLLNKAIKYKNKEYLVGVSVSGKINWADNIKGNFVTNFSWNSTDEKYMKIGNTAINTKKIENISFDLVKNVLQQFNRSHLLLKIEANYSHNLNKKLNVGKLAAPEIIENLVEPNFLYQSANIVSGNLLLRYDYYINKKYAVYVKGNYRYTRFPKLDSDINTNKLYGMGLGLTF
jgi:hypothetical protein